MMVPRSERRLEMPGCQRCRRYDASALRALLAVLAPLILLSGCIDPIDLDIGPPERLLVVNGLVKEGPGPHHVILARTGGFTGPEAVRPRETGAVVSVITGDGEEIPFMEVAPGRYESIPGALVGVPEQSYVLSIMLADGSAYRSRPEVMLRAPEIADFYAEIEPFTRVVNGVSVTRHRVVLFADAARKEDGASFYRWTWSGTYSALLEPKEEVVMAGPCIDGMCNLCFRSLSNRSPVYLGSDQQFSGPVVPRQRAGELTLTDRLPDPDIPFDPTEDELVSPMVGWAFLHGFQITLEQQALSSQTYEFWERAQRMRDDVGSLFDPPAENIPGNVVNVDDPLNVALGYFTVAGTATASACLRRHQFQPEWPVLDTTLHFRGVCGQSLSGTRAPPQAWVDACGGQ